MAGITLTSKTINSTYDSLLKLTDNDGLTASFKKITDGLGNDSGISINNSGNVQISGTLNVSGTTTIGSVLRGNATLTIDPAAHGDNTGLVVIAGDLQVDGTTTTINSTTVSLDDKNILLAADAANKAAANGAGITVETGTNDPVITDATILYNGTNDTWDFNKWVTASKFVGDLQGNVTGTVSSISNHDTDDLSEGSTNLYYTDTRFDNRFSTKDTDDLDEGTTNLYYTTARFNTDFATKDTDDLSEGTTNLYFTDARARGAFSEGTGVTITNGEIAIGQAVGTTDDVTFNQVTADLVGNADSATNADTVDSKHATDFTLDYVTGNNAVTANNITIGSLSATGASFTDPVTIYDSSQSENPRLSVGRGSGESLRFDVEDRVARITHKQDEGTGGHEMWFTIDSPTTSITSKIFYWAERAVDGASSNTLMTLNSTGLNVTGNAQIDDKLVITGTNNNLVIDEESENTWHLYDTFQDNGIIIHSSTGGMEFQYNGVTELTIDGSGVVFNGTVDISDANLNIGAADIVFDTESANANRGLIWDVDGSYQSKLVSGGTNGGLVDINTNMGDGITGSGDVFTIKTGSTAAIALEVRANKHIVGHSNIEALGYIQAHGYLYTRNNLRVLNAAGTDWNTWATRSNGNYNLNVGSVTASSFSGNGSGITNVNADTVDGLHGDYLNHRNYTDTDNYLGGYYVSGGTEKPNSSVFGAGKLKIAMLRGGSPNLGFGGTWNDVLWMSTYTGGDVKRSTALVSSKYDNTSLWIAKQNYDSASWGTGYLIWNSGNDGSGSGLDADTVDGLQASQFLRSDTSDTMSGNLTFSGNSRYIDLSGGTTSSQNALIIGEQNVYGVRFRWDSGSALQFDGYWNSSTTGTENRDLGYIDVNNRIWYLNQRVQANESLRAPIFYDSNNTAYYVNPASTSNLGKVQITGSGYGNDPTLKITTTTSNSFNHAIEAFNPNLTSGEANSLLFGKEGNTKNSGYIGYEWVGAGSNNNFVTIGHWAADHLFRVYPDQITGNSSFRAPIFYDLNNTGYYIHGDGTSRLNILNVNAIGTSVAGIGKVMFPYGAEYNGNGGVTGAFKITLPQSWTNTMMTMKITIFDYSINESFEVHCGGYNYTGSGGYWVNTHAKIIANGEMDRNFNVRFGHDGSKCCILIGETASSWAYPKVVVTEWVGGHSNETFNNWDNGWDISVVTTLPSNIDQTRSNNQIGRYQSIVYDVNNTTYYTNPAGTSYLYDLDMPHLANGTENIRVNIGGQENWRAIALSGGSQDNIGWGVHSSSRSVFSRSGTSIHFPDDGSFRLHTNGWDTEFEVAGGGEAWLKGGLRASIYYDKDNTGYYINGDSTSRLYNLNVTHFGVVNTSQTSRDGISLYGGYSGGEPTYGILFSGTTGFGGHGAVTSDWATYFTMNNNNSRGWIFRRVGSGNAASISGGGTASFNGDVIAYYSDMRLKTKLGDIKDPIGKIQALNGFYYEPNEVAESYGYEKETRVGLSAQEVEAVLPEIVTDAPIGDGYKTVDYAKLVPVLVEAIKDQQKQIDELKSLINKS